MEETITVKLPLTTVRAWLKNKGNIRAETNIWAELRAAEAALSKPVSAPPKRPILRGAVELQPSPITPPITSGDSDTP